MYENVQHQSNNLFRFFFFLFLFLASFLFVIHSEFEGVANNMRHGLIKSAETGICDFLLF